MLGSQVFLGIIVGIGVLFLFIFNYRKFSGVRSDTRLFLKKKSSAKSVQVIDPMTLHEANAGATMKSLNVLFMYNGHSFDAHEILGLPPGASLGAVEQAYAQMKDKMAPESQEFVQTAYNVLKAELKRQGQ